MARIRTIKPDFWKDQELALLSRDARLFYVGLWNFADDDGRCIGDPAYLKGQIFPYDDDARVDLYLEELRSQGKIEQYVSDKGEQFLHVVQLNKHQKIDKRYPSTLPAPPPRTSRAAIPNGVRCALAEKFGAAWKKRGVKVKCQLCGAIGEVVFTARRWVCFVGLEIDHIKPLFLGGESVIENLQLLCRRCNRKKSTKYTPTPPECPPIAAEKSVPYMEGERKGRGEEEEGEREAAPPPPDQAAPGDDEPPAGHGEQDVDGAPEGGWNGAPPGDAPARTGSDQAHEPIALAKRVHEIDPSIPVAKAEVHIRRAIECGAKPEAIREAVESRCRREKLWHVLDELIPRRERQGSGRPNPPRVPPGPPRSDTQRKIDERLASIDAKLAELPTDTIAEWTREAEDAARAAHVPELTFKATVTTTLRQRAAKAFGIEGV